MPRGDSHGAGPRDRDGHDRGRRARQRCLSRRTGDDPTYPLARTHRVEVRTVRARRAAQLALVQDEELVEALAPPAAEEARKWRSPAVLGWASAAPRSGCPPRRGRTLPRMCRHCPASGGGGACRRAARDADAGDPTRAEVDDNEREARPEPQVGDLEEVSGPDIRRMAAEEGGSRLPARRYPPRSRRAQALLDRPLAHPHAQIEELPADPFRPHSRFSAAIRWASATVSAGTGSRFGAAADLARHTRRNPRRCQRSSVDGSTMRSAARQPGARHARRMRQGRSAGVSVRSGSVVGRIAQCAWRRLWGIDKARKAL